MVSCKRLLKSHRFKRFYDGLEKIYDFRMRGKVKHRLSDCLSATANLTTRIGEFDQL